MPVVPMREILDRAFAERYGVAAINVVDDLTLEAVLAAATELEAPLIVQTSLKTVKSLGARQFYAKLGFEDASRMLRTSVDRLLGD